MTFARRWVAVCDEEGCEVYTVIDHIPDGDKWDYGMALNDLGWAAGPNQPKCYCPKHYRELSTTIDMETIVL